MNPNVLHRWRREFRDGVDRAFPGLGKKKVDENRVAELERKIGQQTLEIDFLKRALQRVEESRMLQHQLEWPPKLRQPVKAQISFNGEESHEFVSKKIHQRV